MQLTARQCGNAATQVGRAAVDGAPELYRDTIFRFRTPPAPGTAPGAADRHWQAGSTKTGDHMTLVIIGDIGQTYNSNQTACTVKDRWKSDPSVAAGLIIGDMAYADGARLAVKPSVVLPRAAASLQNTAATSMLSVVSQRGRC